jgi:hypothetical protein
MIFLKAFTRFSLSLRGKESRCLWVMAAIFFAASSRDIRLLICIM